MGGRWVGSRERKKGRGKSGRRILRKREREVGRERVVLWDADEMQADGQECRGSSDGRRSGSGKGECRTKVGHRSEEREVLPGN